MIRRAFGALALAALASCGAPAPSAVPGPAGAAEAVFLETRALADQFDVARAQGEPDTALLAAYRRARGRLVEALMAVDSTRLGPEDRRALATMRQVTATALAATPVPVAENSAGAVACGYDPERLLTAGGDSALAGRIMACYGRAATDIHYRGEELDRLTVLARLGITEDRQEREQLFRALAPLWQSVNGDGGSESPWRQLLRRRAAGWQVAGPPHRARAAALGVPADSVVPWLERVLGAWRAAQPDTVLEPWDWYHYVGGAERALAARLPLERLPAITLAWYRELGADPVRLRVQYDIASRLGKYPVAYTTFGDRPRRTGEGWWPGAPYISAAYRVGGLGNLVELLHETGHAIHIAGIQTRPAFADWPDSDTFTEALADLASLDAYEPAWQWRMVGDSVPLRESLRNKYGGVVLDLVWALFEIRMSARPEADPNVVWGELTSRYLQIRPHPEWSWWAMRGQLVDSPGYMLNYALGSLLTAQLRAAIIAGRGGWTAGDTGWYPWVRDRVYRFGLERPALAVTTEVLGGSVTPEAMLRDLARMAR